MCDDSALYGDLTPVEYAETAASLWEAVLELKDEDSDIGRRVRDAFAAHGTSDIRGSICSPSVIRACDATWRAARDRGFDEPFDWEFCPVFVRAGLDWDGWPAPSVIDDRKPVFAGLQLPAEKAE